MSKKSSNKTLNKGNPTLLHHIKDAIMEWINGKREKGMALSTWMVILRVSRMDPTFRDKKIRSRYSIIRHFLRTNKVSICRKTHEAQKHPWETQDFGRAVRRNYASIFLTVKPRQEVHYQHGPDTNLFQYGSQYYGELCGGSICECPFVKRLYNVCNCGSYSYCCWRTPSSYVCLQGEAWWLCSTRVEEFP